MPMHRVSQKEFLGMGIKYNLKFGNINIKLLQLKYISSKIIIYINQVKWALLILPIFGFVHWAMLDWIFYNPKSQAAWSQPCYEMLLVYADDILPCSAVSQSVMDSLEGHYL